MRSYIILTLISLIPFMANAQSNDSIGNFGFSVYSSVNGEPNPIRIVPSLVYIKGKNQLELGFGFNPFIRETQKLMSGEFNYKYYPNGTKNKFNMYLIARFSYINSSRETFYPTTFNYLFLNGGYGFEIIPKQHVFFGTNLSLGGFTFNKRSEIPYAAFESQNLFEEIELNLAFQFNVGYRF